MENSRYLNNYDEVISLLCHDLAIIYQNQKGKNVVMGTESCWSWEAISGICRDYQTGNFENSSENLK